MNTVPIPTKQNISAQIKQNIANLHNLQFLLEATSLLSSSLDYEKTLSQIASLAVPGFADWCVIHVVNATGKASQIAVKHTDPKKMELALRLQEEYPEDPNSQTGVNHVLRTGISEFMSDIPEDLILAGAKNSEHAHLLKQLGLRSYICVPLLAHRRIVGAITFVSAESGRIYTEDNLAFMEDLARIAAIAVDNALLYNEAQVEIEKRKKAEEELSILNKSLEQKVADRTKKLELSNRELQDFAYVASHDLQEPLRKIQAFGDLLKEEYGEKLGSGKEYVNRMLHASGRMRILIDDLLAFSRVTTKALPFSRVDLGQIMREVVIDLESTILENKGTITLDETFPKIEADPFQMRQLFQNILSNALKFHKKEKPPIITVTVKEVIDQSSEEESKKWLISIADNGIGFDEKYLDRIFTIFERLHGRNDFSGTGIGLAVCRKIVERHYGILTAKSNPDVGTTFLLTLPETQPKEKGGEQI